MSFKIGGFSGKKVGRYRLFDLLGSGAFGGVYQATDLLDPHDSPEYAIKCILANKKHRNQQISEIVNHDKVTGCPNVMTLCDYFDDVFDDKRYYFLVFPICEMDMFRAIWKGRLYFRNDALIKEVFVEILDGVHACHLQGIYHRDLKPENIMCNSDGRGINITDFGLSSDRLVCRDGGCGTLCYLGPECMSKKEPYYFGDTADIWSLGVILFDMVTCRHPWEFADKRDDEFMAYMADKDYFLKTSTISEPLSTLLHQIWNPIPEMRASIPKIRKAVLGIETFYKKMSIAGAARLSKEVALAAISDSEQTRVAVMEDEKKKDVCSASGSPLGAISPGFLEEITLDQMDLERFPSSRNQMK